MERKSVWIFMAVMFALAGMVSSSWVADGIDLIFSDGDVTINNSLYVGGDLNVSGNLYATNQEEILYNFVDYTNSCTRYNNSNPDDLNCSAGTDPSFTYFDNATEQWNLFCCEFGTKCTERNDTVAELVCQNNVTAEFVALTVWSDEHDKYKSLCCNAQGGSCFVDIIVEPTQPETVCDGSYTENQLSVQFVNNTWNGICCTGGVQ